MNATLAAIQLLSCAGVVCAYLFARRSDKALIGGLGASLAFWQARYRDLHDASLRTYADYEKPEETA